MSPFWQGFCKMWLLQIPISLCNKNPVLLLGHGSQNLLHLIHNKLQLSRLHLQHLVQSWVICRLKQNNNQMSPNVITSGQARTRAVLKQVESNFVMFSISRVNAHRITPRDLIPCLYICSVWACLWGNGSSNGYKTWWHVRLPHKTTKYLYIYMIHLKATYMT